MLKIVRYSAYLKVGATVALAGVCYLGITGMYENKKLDLQKKLILEGLSEKDVEMIVNRTFKYGKRAKVTEN